jgi:hypothetical protein
MNTANAESLLRVWEECQGVHPIRRAIALLDAAAPDAGVAAWGDAPIGQRDGRLLELYEMLFGPQLQAVTHCPSCNELLEIAFATGDTPASTRAPEAQNTFKYRNQGCSIEYRLPGSEDLLHVTATTDARVNTQIQLLRRCIVEANRAGRRHPLEQLPADIVDGLAGDMAKHDPGANVQIQLDCPGCGHAWSAAFDIVSCFWSAVEEVVAPVKGKRSP